MLSEVIDALARANCKPTRSGNDAFTAYCPVHETDGHNHKPSLSVAAGDHVDVVLNCHAGCSHAAIFKALGIEPKAGKAGKAGTSKRIVATYPYQDASGKVLFEKVRYEPKDFRIRHRDASGAEVWRLPRGIEPPLYRLPELLAAIASGEPIFVCEGCKDADRLVAAGLCATTNFEGAAKGNQNPKWRASYTAALAGADVVLLPDNDEPGKAHMRHVAAALAGKALVRWLELPGLPTKGDVSDWLNQGHTVDELRRLAADASHQPDASNHDVDVDCSGLSAQPSRFMEVSELCLNPPKENWLIKGFFTLDSLTVLFGDPSSGKSFLAIDLACHVACGRPWRGQKVRQGKVLYIAGEGRNGLSKRFKAWFDYYGEPPRNIQLCLTPIALSDPASIAALTADIQALPEPPALIVIDTVNRNFGAGDENSTADMTKAVAGMDTLRNATRAAILGLHHSGHADKGRGRGSSVLKASTDVEYATEKNDHTVQVRCTKSKDFDYPAPLSWSLDKQPLPWADEDGLPLDSAVLNPTDTPAHDPASRLAGQPRKALELLDTLYQQQRGNLESSGHDPEQARVAAADWYEAMRGICEDKANRSRLRRTLIDGGHVRLENGFVYQVVKVVIR